MNRTVAVRSAVALAVGGAGAVWWFGQGTETPPSVDVTAPPVGTTTTTPACRRRATTTAAPMEAGGTAPPPTH
jgi:hypothetical protein